MYTVSTIISTAIHTHVAFLITSKKRQSKLLLFINSRKRFQPLSPFLQPPPPTQKNRINHKNKATRKNNQTNINNNKKQVKAPPKIKHQQNKTIKTIVLRYCRFARVLFG